MSKFLVFSFWFLVVSCATAQVPLDKPKDYGDVIVETQREMEVLKEDDCVQKSPVLQSKVGSLQSKINAMSMALTECEKYGKDTHDKLAKCNYDLERKEKEIKSLKDDIYKLENRFFSPLQVKFAWWILGISAVVGLFYFLYKMSDKIKFKVG